MNALGLEYVTATVRQLDERFHELIAREQAGVITQAETAELDDICHAKEGVGVPMIAPDVLKRIFGDAE